MSGSGASAAARDFRSAEGDPSAAGPHHELALARMIVDARADRGRFLRAELLGDPGWDMLLDLFIARLEGRRICVSSLCIAAGIPATTAHRWIKAMEAAGEIERRADDVDGRRVFLAISDQTFVAMRAYLRRLEQRLHAHMASWDPARGGFFQGR